MERMTERGANGYFVRLVKNGTQTHKINIVEDESVCEEILVDPLNKVGKTVQMPVTRIEGDIVDRLAEYENTGMSPRACLKIGDVSGSEGFWAAGKQFFRRNPGGFQGKIAPSRGQKDPPVGHVDIFQTSPRQIIALICGKDIIREVSPSEINQAFEDGYRKAMNEVSNG